MVKHNVALRCSESTFKDPAIALFLKENCNLVSHSKNVQQYVEFLSEINTIKNKINDSYQRYLKQEASENEIFLIFDNFFKCAEAVEKETDDRIFIGKLKQLFRNSIYEYISQSTFVKRGYCKPRGYPGDFEIIEAMYNNIPVSKNIGYLIDKYFLKNDYVQAVRDRKDKMKLFLKNFFYQSSNSEINILNLACGSCRELRELFIKERFMDEKRVIFDLIDQDEGALRFAKNELKNTSVRVKFNFLKRDVLDFFRNKKSFKMKKSIKSYDLIYSIGLADYLPNSVLGLLLKYSYCLLKENGRIIIAHKNTKRYTSPISDWGSDWKFIPRNKKDIEELLEKYIKKDGGKYKIKYFKEANKYIFFIELMKN